MQVGDPFTEKLLLEASLELIASGAITGIQDMGAAGLTSSASEMAGRAGNGVEIDVARVPVREPGMTPYEILLSESQERMLVVAERGREDEVRRILGKWELEAAVIGPRDGRRDVPRPGGGDRGRGDPRGPAHGRLPDLRARGDGVRRGEAAPGAGPE